MHLPRQAPAPAAPQIEDILRAVEGAQAAERQVQCRQYAGFMSHLSHGDADAVYWSLTAYQLICLVYVVVVYENVTRKYKDTEAKAGSGEFDSLQVEELRDRARRIAKSALIKNSIVFMTLVVATVMEIFSANVLLFCHSERLMHLYFPVWTIFAIGITVATLGCCITQAYAIKSMQLPPFGVSLGTPVLVVGAISHFAYSYITGKGRTNWSAESGLSHARSRTSTHSQSRDVALVSGPTIPLCDIEVAMRSGSNLPIIQLWNGEDPLPRDAVHIGRLSQGYHIIEREVGHANLAKAPSLGTASSSTATNTANGDEHRAPPLQKSTTAPGALNSDEVETTIKFKEPVSRPC